MYEYSFLSSPLCHRAPQPPKQVHLLQHLLPPDTLHLKQQKQTIKSQQNLTTALAKKTQQIGVLQQKNNELVEIISHMEAERLRIEDKYAQLMVMYEEIRGNGATSGMEIAVDELKDEIRALGDRNRQLERDNLELEKELMRKTKLFEEKNQDSRKLLEKLNENITKREEKLKAELSEAQHELRKKNQVLTKLEEDYHELESVYNEKEEQLTKIMQETERDRSALSQNLTTVEIKLHTENQKLHQDISMLKQLLQQARKSTNTRVGQLQHEYDSTIKQNSSLHLQCQQLTLQLQRSSQKQLQLQLQLQQSHNNKKLLELDLTQLTNRLKAKSSQCLKQTQQNRIINQELEHLHEEQVALQEDVQRLAGRNQQLEGQLLVERAELGKIRDIFEEKIGYITDLEVRAQEEARKRAHADREVERLETKNRDIGTALTNERKKTASLEELLDSYKTQRMRIRQQNQTKWKQMTEMYENEIQKLNTKILKSHHRVTTKFSPQRQIKQINNESDYS